MVLALLAAGTGIVRIETDDSSSLDVPPSQAPPGLPCSANQDWLDNSLLSAGQAWDVDDRGLEPMLSLDVAQRIQKKVFSM